jgi:N-glycosylase/DNA lyase
MVILNRVLREKSIPLYHIDKHLWGSATPEADKPAKKPADKPP